MTAPLVTAPLVPLRWFDNHAHVHDARLGDAVLDASRAAGVAGMVTVGCDLPTTHAAIAVAERNADVWATVGLHPHDARLGLDGLEALLVHPRVVAVGECGLDYYYDHSPRDTQREVFAAQIQWAHHHRLPLVIHTRDAWPDTFDVLAANGVPEHTVFHCFTAGPAEARRCLDLGALLSFSGVVTFKNSADNKDAARLCPLDRLLVETDSPYLAPDPYRGRRNEPAYVVRVGEVVAALRDQPVELIAECTTRNALAFYGVEIPEAP
jgi:TatD DNase family protein